MTYDRATVERTLPWVWDTTHAYAYGVRDPRAADADMPQGRGDPSHGNAILAVILDVRSALRGAGLTADEREALYLRYARDLIPLEIGELQETPRRTIVSRLERAVGRLVDELNGTVDL